MAHTGNLGGHHLAMPRPYFLRSRARVKGLGFRVLGFGVQGLGLGVWDLGFRLWGLGFGVEGLRLRFPCHPTGNGHDSSHAT